MMIRYVGMLTDIEGQSWAFNYSVTVDQCIYGMKLVLALTDKEQETLKKDRVIHRGDVVKIQIIDTMPELNKSKDK